MADGTEKNWLSDRLGVGATLTRAQINALNALPWIVRECEPGHYLVRDGDRPKYCTYLQSGFAYRHKIVGDGGRQIVSINVAGDFIDAQNLLLEQSDHNIQILTDAVVKMIAIDDMLAITRTHPAVAQALWRETLVEAAITREWVTNIGRRDARTRTAHVLCEMAMRREAAGLGARETFYLPMTQEQFGDALGLTAVHVNRTLKTLEGEGLITRNKRSVTVADWQGLQQVGDFTSSYLHLSRNAARDERDD